jgi:DHA3 family macrolide efflux protein-like MFS transporter
MIGSKETASAWKLRFFTVYTGQAISLLGSSLVQFALVWWLTSLTNSANVLAGATLVAILPSVLLGPLVGALVDRWNRKAVLMIADGSVALFSLWLAYLFYTNQAQIGHIYLVMLLRGVGGAFHWPAMQASTTLMVPQEHLSRVAGLNQTLDGVMRIASPPLGALLIAWLPMWAVMLVDVVTAAAAVGLLALVSIPQPLRSAAAAGQGAGTLWSETKAGVRYVWGWGGLVLLLVMASVMNFFSTPVFTFIPLLVTRYFKGGALELGWMEAAFAVGLTAGGLVLGVWGGFRKRVVTSFVGLIGFGAATLILGFSPLLAGLWLGLAAQFLTGFMNPLINGPFLAVIQDVVEPDMQGRVMALISALAAAMSPLSLLLAGPLVERFGLLSWIWVSGGVFVGMGAAAFFVPALLHIEERRRASQAR